MTDTHVPTIGDLFERSYLGQWGTRGDTYLWTELAEHLRDEPVPGSWWGLRKVLEDAFEKLTEHKMDSYAEPFYVERLNPGHGISAGYVSPSWWADTAVPVLAERAVERGLITK